MKLDELLDTLLGLAPIIFIVLINIVLGKLRSKGKKVEVNKEPPPQRRAPCPPKKKAPAFQIVKPKPISQLPPLKVERATDEEIKVDEKRSKFLSDAIVYSEIIGKPLALRDEE